MVSVISLVFLTILVLVLYTVFYGAPFVVSDKKTLRKVLKLASAKKGDKVVDLGSGDGRIVVEFAKRGLEARGFEINPLLYIFSLLRAKLMGLDKAHFRFGSYWNMDLSEYDVVVVFGISYIMRRLEKKLKKDLKKGAKVVTISYKFPSWKPVKSENGVFLYRK